MEHIRYFTFKVATHKSTYWNKIRFVKFAQRLCYWIEEKRRTFVRNKRTKIYKLDQRIRISFQQREIILQIQSKRHTWLTTHGLSVYCFSMYCRCQMVFPVYTAEGCPNQLELNFQTYDLLVWKWGARNFFVQSFIAVFLENYFLHLLMKRTLNMRLKDWNWSQISMTKYSRKCKACICTYQISNMIKWIPPFKKVSKIIARGSNSLSSTIRKNKRAVEIQMYSAEQ